MRPTQKLASSSPACQKRKGAPVRSRSDGSKLQLTMWADDEDIDETLPVTRFTSVTDLSFPHPSSHISSSQSLIHAYRWDPLPTPVPQGLHEIAPGLRRPSSAAPVARARFGIETLVERTLPKFEETARRESECRGTRTWLHGEPKPTRAPLPEGWHEMAPGLRRPLEPPRPVSALTRPRAPGARPRANHAKVRTVSLRHAASTPALLMNTDYNAQEHPTGWHVGMGGGGPPPVRGHVMLRKPRIPSWGPRDRLGDPRTYPRAPEPKKEAFYDANGRPVFPPKPPKVASVEGVLEALRAIMAANKGRVSEIFLQYDADRSRRIERAEFAKACKALGVHAPAAVLTATFDALDVDLSGQLELTELNSKLRRRTWA